MMKKNLIGIVLFITLFSFAVKSVHGAETVTLSFSPAVILQGDPVLVQVNGIHKIALVKTITFAGKALGIFLYQNKPGALIGIDLNKKPGVYTLTTEMADGTILKQSITVGKRDVTEAPLGIPEKLGGNTKQSQDTLVASLNAEKKSIAGIKTSSKALWNEVFLPPLRQIFVTDPYGNSRKTGVYSIPHKGVDYRAKGGTEVIAVNTGIVRIAQAYRDYGNTVFIDHGLGLVSSYLHLSKIKVKVGDVVKRGQVIGLSGETGYAEGAHLHLGIRINDIAIDPVKFFALFK